MIQISLEKKKTIITLTIKGHSNSAEYGKDIICASVSTIVEFLGVYFDVLESKYKINLVKHIESGNALFEFSFIERNLMKAIEVFFEKH